MNERSDASTSTEDIKAGPLCLFFFSHPFGVLSSTPPTVLCEAGEAGAANAVKVASWARARLPPLETPGPLRSRGSAQAWDSDARGPERLPPLERTPITLAPRRRRRRRHPPRRAPLARLVQRTIHGAIPGVCSVSGESGAAGAASRQSRVSARLSDVLASLRSAWLATPPPFPLTTRERFSRHASAAGGGSFGRDHMVRRHSAPEADLRRFLVTQRRYDSEEANESAGGALSGSWRELPATAPTPAAAPVPITAYEPAAAPAPVRASFPVFTSAPVFTPDSILTYGSHAATVYRASSPVYTLDSVFTPASEFTPTPVFTSASDFIPNPVFTSIPDFTPAPVIAPAPEVVPTASYPYATGTASHLFEIVVSQGKNTRDSQNHPPRHRPSLTTDIDEYVSEILAESLHSLGDRLESVTDGSSVSVVEKEIKVRLQNTGVNTVVHLSPKSNHQIIFGNEELCLRESERERERALSLHRLHHLFEENHGCGGESPGSPASRASPAISLVDSLDEPVTAPGPHTPPLQTTAAPTHIAPTHTDSEAFFIRIDDGTCDSDKDKVVVADHMPEKIRRRLNRRQRRRELRIERARRMRSLCERERAGIEPRRECAIVLRGLVEAVAAAVAARPPSPVSPPGRRPSRIPVRVAERPAAVRRWSHVFEAIPEERISPPVPSTLPSPERDQEVKQQRTISTQANSSNCRQRRPRKLPPGGTPSSSERASVSSSTAPPPPPPRRRPRRTASPGGWSLRLAGGRAPLDLQLRLRLQPRQASDSCPSCQTCVCRRAATPSPSVCNHHRTHTTLTEEVRSGVVALCGDVSGVDSGAGSRRRRVAGGGAGRRALSVRGRGISPELKPRAPSQTERDLTRNRTRRNTLL